MSYKAVQQLSQQQAPPPQQQQQQQLQQLGQQVTGNPSLAATSYTVHSTSAVPNRLALTAMFMKPKAPANANDDGTQAAVDRVHHTADSVVNFTTAVSDSHTQCGNAAGHVQHHSISSTASRHVATANQEHEDASGHNKDTTALLLSAVDKFKPPIPRFASELTTSVGPHPVSLPPEGQSPVPIAVTGELPGLTSGHNQHSPRQAAAATAVNMHVEQEQAPGSLPVLQPQPTPLGRSTAGFAGFSFTPLPSTNDAKTPEMMSRQSGWHLQHHQLLSAVKGRTLQFETPAGSAGDWYNVNKRFTTCYCPISFASLMMRLIGYEFHAYHTCHAVYHRM